MAKKSFCVIHEWTASSKFEQFTWPNQQRSLTQIFLCTNSLTSHVPFEFGPHRPRLTSAVRALFSFLYLYARAAVYHQRAIETSPIKFSAAWIYIRGLSTCMCGAAASAWFNALAEEYKLRFVRQICASLVRSRARAFAMKLLLPRVSRCIVSRGALCCSCLYREAVRGFVEKIFALCLWKYSFVYRYIKVFRKNCPEYPWNVLKKEKD